MDETKQTKITEAVIQAVKEITGKEIPVTPKMHNIGLAITVGIKEEPFKSEYIEALEKKNPINSVDDSTRCCPISVYSCFPTPSYGMHKTARRAWFSLKNG
jgi:hypothetical protein